MKQCVDGRQLVRVAAVHAAANHISQVAGSHYRMSRYVRERAWRFYVKVRDGKSTKDDLN